VPHTTGAGKFFPKQSLLARRGRGGGDGGELQNAISRITDVTFSAWWFSMAWQLLWWWREPHVSPSFRSSDALTTENNLSFAYVPVLWQVNSV